MFLSDDIVGGSQPATPEDVAMIESRFEKGSRSPEERGLIQRSTKKPKTYSFSRV